MVGKALRLVSFSQNCTPNHFPHCVRSLSVLSYHHSFYLQLFTARQRTTPISCAFPKCFKFNQARTSSVKKQEKINYNYKPGYERARPLKIYAIRYKRPTFVLSGHRKTCIISIIALIFFINDRSRRSRMSAPTS